MRGWFLVALGGVAGSAARWATGEVVPHARGEFPWATLVVNVVGCLLIGIAAGRLTRGSDRWLLLVTGVLGGFTTFSAFAVETRQLLDDGAGLTAMTYVAVSLVLGLGATRIGRRTSSGPT